MTFGKIKNRIYYKSSAKYLFNLNFLVVFFNIF